MKKEIIITTTSKNQFTKKKNKNRKTTLPIFIFLQDYGNRLKIIIDFMIY